LPHNDPDHIDRNEVTHPNRNTDTDRDRVAVTDLLTEIRHLKINLEVVRRLYADLVAAARAALVAEADGEPDPLSYLRTELPPAPYGHPLHLRSGVWPPPSRPDTPAPGGGA